VLQPVQGAFNLAADPVVDAHLLADCLDARVVSMPLRAVRAAVAALWHLHVIPAAPQLLDLVLRLPIMDTGRARSELGWTPQHDARDAIEAFLAGLRDGAGLATPPLQPRMPGGRLQAIPTGVGQRP
jgi:nucleoside-diphosphate-sugar epimerase